MQFLRESDSIKYGKTLVGNERFISAMIYETKDKYYEILKEISLTHVKWSWHLREKLQDNVS